MSLLLLEMIPFWFYRLEQRKGLFAVGRLCVKFLQIILILSGVWQRRGHVELNVNMRRFIVTKVKSAEKNAIHPVFERPYHDIQSQLSTTIVS